MHQRGIHHIAIICSDYARSRAFYADTLGLPIISEEFRAERSSHKLNLALSDSTQIELFSFPNPPARPTRPEACGLRHLGLRVSDLAAAVAELTAKGIAVEPIRIDAVTGAPFTFFSDPDDLPIELYQEA